MTGPKRSLEIAPVGNLGNQMLQLVLATAIADQAPGLEIKGHDMPLWGLTGAPGRQGWLPSLKGHHIDAAFAARLYRMGLLKEARLTGLGFRCEAYGSPSRYRSLFTSAVRGRVFGPDVLLINVRAGEVLGDVHPDYGPLPHAYYERLIAETGLNPVFLGQLDDGPYSQALKARFPHAEFVPHQGVLEDFEALRGAANVVCSISTFSWIAAWLSDARRVFLPVAGLFNPGQRPEVNLLPVDHERYVFHAFPVRRWRGSPEDFAALSDPTPPALLTHEEIRVRLAKARRAETIPHLKAQARLLLSALRR